ncbi:MAG: DNA-directed RNA polymerase subunit alpha C-terminal domain-containing protein [Phycisphaerae bacterium]
MTTAIAALDGIADQIRAGRLDEAGAALDSIEETPENRAELLFLRGRLLEQRHDYPAAGEAYQAALNEDPEHAEAAFHAALLCDRLGDDEGAIAWYERCVDRPQTHVHAMLNLALLYEEHGDLKSAETCVDAVLKEQPNHRRAQSFKKSIVSTYTMVFDERTQAEQDRHNAVLDAPISDFELSVRSRNCLRQMNIRSISDLLKSTEAQLLAYKNFGETSLSEIKAMLAQKGLRIGQALRPAEGPDPESLANPAGPAGPVGPTDPAAPAGLSPQVVSMHASRSVSDLELSLRSRKALQRLGVSTIGELCQHSETELMTIKNFGQTSMDEIRRQLEKYGLDFRKA